MTISNSSLEGNTGLVVKGGVVNIVDSQIRGIQNIHEPPEDVMSGFATTGDGLYLEGSSNYTWSAVVNVSGDKTVVTSTAADTVAIRLFVGANASAVKQINVMGGKFNTDVSEFLVNGATQTKVDETEYVVTLPEEP